MKRSKINKRKINQVSQCVLGQGEEMRSRADEAARQVMKVKNGVTRNGDEVKGQDVKNVTTLSSGSHCHPHKVMKGQVEAETFLEVTA